MVRLGRLELREIKPHRRSASSSAGRRRLCVRVPPCSASLRRATWRRPHRWKVESSEVTDVAKLSAVSERSEEDRGTERDVVEDDQRALGPAVLKGDWADYLVEPEKALSGVIPRGSRTPAGSRRHQLHPCCCRRLCRDRSRQKEWCARLCRGRGEMTWHAHKSRRT